MIAMDSELFLIERRLDSKSPENSKSSSTQSLQEDIKSWSTSAQQPSPKPFDVTTFTLTKKSV
jgi:hypothetical protein